MEFLIPIVAIFFVIGVPVMAIASHFVLRPLVRDVIQAIHGRKVEEQADLEGRLGRLEEALLDQSRQIDRLLEAEAFRSRLEERQLGAARGPDRSLPGTP